MFAGTCIIPAIAQGTEKPLPASSGNWLYVGGGGPGNYTKIQDAINESSVGDTLFVYSGTYHEHIIIQHTISLIGEDKDNTIIVGNETVRVVNVTADYVNITGFTIQGGYEGILIEARCAKITDNRLTNNAYGIGLNFPYMNDKNIPKNPSAFMSWNRTYSYQNDCHIVVNNTISSNEIGIIIYGNSCNNTLTSNVLSQSRLGVVIFGSCNNKLTNNIFVNSGLYVSNDTYSNSVVNNTVNGKPLLYLEEQYNQVIQDSVGQLILLRCHNITVIGQEITNTSYGIELVETTQCHISQNIITSNACSGIDLYNGRDNTIMNNIISANAESGIQFHTNNNTIIGNTITFNKHHGLNLFSSDSNAIVNNTISNNHYGGIDIGYSDDYNLISGNFIQSNGECGITMTSGRNNILSQNDIISNSDEGIYISQSEHTIIQNNTLSHHSVGIRFLESSNNNITGNIITENGYGIAFDFACDSNVISGKNSLINNTYYGIQIERSDSNIISNNDFINNSGIVCSVSQKNIINENTISWNQPSSNYETGILLGHSTNITITHNTIINAARGVEIGYESEDNTILRNNISHSFYEAIHCFISGSNNHITGNTLTENTLGINIQNSNDILVINNSITNSTEAGINIYDSFHTTIRENIVSGNFNGIFMDYGATDTILKENTIARNLGTGIFIKFTAVNNTIAENIIHNNNLGINISGDSNFIHHNMISHNPLGIYIWRSRSNSICCNTFLFNYKHASFRLYFNDGHNNWNKNYWGHPRILPHIIVGKVWFIYPMVIPWVNVDWHPASEPHNIPEMR